jgi:hypothetical protein
MDTDTTIPAVLIILVFIWRFIRTHQLYTTSLQNDGPSFELRDLHDLRSFVSQVLLGHRRVEPESFFIRGAVFAIVTACLFPFRSYEPVLYWLVVALVSIYVPWCAVYGILLKRDLRRCNT